MGISQAHPHTARKVCWLSSGGRKRPERPLPGLTATSETQCRNVLSSVGAAVFIVALAIEPFSQQLLSYYTCPQVIPSGASLPRTQYYRGLDHTHLFAGMSGTDYGLQSNAYAGIFSNSPIQVEFECTSGNCTFDEFASVGICSHCDEIHGIEIATETAQGRNGDEGPILTSAFARNYSIFTGESLVQTNNVNTSPPYFPFEFLVGDSSLGPGFGSNVSVQFLAANPWWTSITNEDGDESLPPPSDCSAPSRNTSWPCKGQGAANCTIGICVKTYRSEVTNGKLVENVTSTFANFSLTPDYGMVDTGCIPPALRANLTNQGNITDEPRFQQLDPIPWNELDIPDACFYKVEMGTASGTARFVGDFLTGNVSFDYANDFTAPPMYPSVTAGPVQLQRLWMNGNMTIDSLNEMLGVMTESMTTYLRQTGEANVSAPVLGTSVVYDTCIAVQWGWLALPAALQAVTVAFLCALMLRIRLTHSGSSSAWKTSALALIFHSLDREILDRDGGRLHRMDEMKEKAGRLKVRMEPSGRGWKLVEEIRIVR